VSQGDGLLGVHAVIVRSVARCARLDILRTTLSQDGMRAVGHA
jgi:hypothetical protein